MYKTLLVIALIVSAATLIPLTSQAFLGPVWTPFSIGSSSGCGYGGGYGGGYYGGYGSAGYGGYELGRSHGYTGHHKYKGAVRSEDKTRADRDLRPIHQQRGTRAGENTGPTEEKSREKALMKGERKHKPSEMGPQGAVESHKQREMDIKAKQHKPDTSRMMERGRSEQEKPEKKGASGQVEVPAGTGHADEKIK
jgi:hypothetical protein